MNAGDVQTVEDLKTLVAESIVDALPLVNDPKTVEVMGNAEALALANNYMNTSEGDILVKINAIKQTFTEKSKVWKEVVESIRTTRMTTTTEIALMAKSIDLLVVKTDAVRNLTNALVDLSIALDSPQLKGIIK